VSIQRADEEKEALLSVFPSLRSLDPCFGDPEEIDVFHTPHIASVLLNPLAISLEDW
jgi:hypothetical protein